MMKLCEGCGDTKALPEFYGNGYGQSRCRECVKARTRQNYRKNISARRAYERKRARTSKRKKHMSDACARHRAANPDRYRARTAVSNALRDGRLQRQPCEVCGAKKVQAHHDDYSKPLQVRWFCKRHHDSTHGTSAAP